MNDVNSMISLWMGTWKNPEGALSVQNTVAPAILGVVSSTLGNMQ